MTKHILHIMTLLLCTLCLVCTACTEDIPSSPAGEEQGYLVLSYSVGDSEVSTRAEGGWEAWNENKITRLDLFVFESNGDKVAYYSSTMDTEAGPDEATQTWSIPLASWNAAGNNTNIQADDMVYLIANYAGAAEWANITNLSDLQKVPISDLVCYQKQNSFIMDGKITVTDAMIPDANHINIGVIPLKRAAAKIRVKFASQTDWDDVSYRFYHYMTSAQLLEPERTAEDTWLSSQTVSVYPEETAEMAEVSTTSTDPDNNYYADGKQLVLYSYANNWLDESKWEDINQVEPIDETKQTYLILYAPYEGEHYYYKVPVNYRLPDNLDDVDLDIDDYRHLYRLQRNYIYDITVNIDRPGGTVTDPGELVNLTYEVNPWEREDIMVNYENELSYMSEGWDEETIQGYLNDNETEIHIDPTQPAELSFQIPTPAHAIWRAQLTGADIEYFEFVDGTDHGNARDENGNVATQTIRIQCTHPESEETHSVTLHVYATIYGETYELDLTNRDNEEHSPNENNDPISRFIITQGM